MAAYFVHWTEGNAAHLPNVDLVIGAWGDGAVAEHRVLVCLQFNPEPTQRGVMVVDAAERIDRYRTLCGRALRRAEVVGQPLAAEVFALIDGLWRTEDCVAELERLS